MSLDVIDPMDPYYLAAYQRHRRENGAVTYAREISRHHLPLWREYAKDREVRVSTAPLLRRPEHRRRFDLTVQYLHTFPYDKPLGRVEQVSRNLRGMGRLVFVSAYLPLHNLLIERGYESVWVPMRIDVQRVQKVARYRGLSRSDMPPRYAYFGNLHNPGKPEWLAKTRDALRAHNGAELVHVGSSDQAECLRRLNKGFTHGVGVGRCALEMMALGMRVLIVGSRFGGLVMDPVDWVAQEEINFNGRVMTGVSSLAEGVAWWDDAFIPAPEQLDHGVVGPLRIWMDRNW